MRKTLFTLIVAMAGIIVVAGQSLPSFQISTNYRYRTTAFDKTKVLNVARGGQGISGNLSWMPKYYDKLVEIGIDEFRVDWLLSNRFYNVVTRNSSGVLQYNFTNLDKTILPMIQKGIKPMMCMTYMATPLGKDSFPPTSYDEYSATIRAYVQYYKNKGYTGWAWESHNEPEGFTKLTPSQTYAMYKAFSIAVKSVDSTARVGGFGAVGLDWIGYIRSFLDLYKNDTQRPPMDYFSFHQYGRNAWEYVSVIENEFTTRGLTIPDLYITEWNNHWGTAPGQGNFGIAGTGNSFDTNVNASYLAKKMHSVYSHSNVKKIYYFNFADTDTRKYFSGDMGLFTVDTHHRKAGANTFLMFNRMYNQQLPTIVSGDNTSSKNAYGFVTVDAESKKLAAILWNYQNTATVARFTCSNLPTLPEGWVYQIDKYLIDSMNGNHYYDFKRMNWTSSFASPNEKIKIVKTYTSSSSIINITDTLTRYSVVQYLIQPVQLATSIHEVSTGIRQLKVVPNPCKSDFSAIFRLEKMAGITLAVYNTQGILISRIEKDNCEPFIDHNIGFNTGNWKNDTYLLTMYIEGKRVESVKFMKE